MKDDSRLNEKLDEISKDTNIHSLLNAMNRLKVLQKRLKYLGQEIPERAVSDQLELLKSKIRQNEHLQVLFDKLTGDIKRTEVIQKVCSTLNAQTYIEIGVRHGDCFTQIEAPRKIAIDPIQPKPAVAASLKEGVFYYEMYSDDFFSSHTDLFSEKKIDVAFVDGLHTYQQSLRDALNCLDHMSERGVLVMHDCNPTDEAKGIPAPLEEVAMECAAQKGLLIRGGWMGDVWKTIVYLRSLRPDLYVCTLDCDWGIGLVMKGVPENPLSFSALDIDCLTYQDFEKNRNLFLNLKEQDFLYDFLAMLKKQDKALV